jgi:hypothetical protein
MHSRGPAFSVFGMRVVRVFGCSHEVFGIRKVGIQEVTLGS